MAFGKSTNDILLNIGIVPPNMIVQVTYGISFTGSLTNPNELSFNIPYNNMNANSLAFMDITVENAARVRSAKVTRCSSTFSKGHRTFSKQKITSSPIITITTSTPIESTAICTLIDQDQYLGLSIIPDVQSSEIFSEVVFFGRLQWFYEWSENSIGP
jgi:hypothetical protein